MIAVIADDLTGAAELAGIGLQYGLNVEIQTGSGIDTDADLLVISTDSRSMPVEKALQITSVVTRNIASHKPDFIFKKIDSALRGYVVAETEVMLEILQTKSALVVPANPALGRQIIDGMYYVQGQPIGETGFADDPEFPVKLSRISEMITPQKVQVFVMKPADELPAEGIIIGEVATAEDLSAWALRRNKHTLPEGSSGFFTAVMDTVASRRAIAAEPEKDRPSSPALYIIGTAFNKSKARVREVKDAGGPVSYMPAEIIQSTFPSDASFARWSHEIVTLMSRFGTAIIAIEENSVKETGVSAKDLRERTAQVVAHVIESITLHDLYIEGGSTATAVIKKLNLTTFIPVRAWSTGVVRMKVKQSDPMYFTIKPGSYEWPEGAWTFNETKSKR